MTRKYRCCLMEMDRTVVVQIIESDDDAGAVLEADKVLAASASTIAELWEGPRMVSMLSRKAPAASLQSISRG